ncbi:MAG: hypothetical protein WDM94_08285 [Bauldia sp.]
MQRVVRLSAVLVLAAMAGSPVVAEDAPATNNPPAALACTNSGMHYEPGDFACIAACHGRRRLARCDTVSNTATWTYIQDICPTSMINAPWPSEWSEVPALAAMSPIPVTVDRSAIPPDVRFAFVSLGAVGQ